MRSWRVVLIVGSLVVGTFTAVKAYGRHDMLLAADAALLVANGVMWTIRGSSKA